MEGLELFVVVNRFYQSNGKYDTIIDTVFSNEESAKNRVKELEEFYKDNIDYRMIEYYCIPVLGLMNSIEKIINKKMKESKK